MRRIAALGVLVAILACKPDAPSIAAYCAGQIDAGHPCVQHWSDAAAAWDQFCTAAHERYGDAAFETCRGANIVLLGSLDTSQTYFYDAVTGALVGIQDESPVGTTIIAGTIPNIDRSTCSMISDMVCIRP
jgi:hypothetical protein